MILLSIFVAFFAVFVALAVHRGWHKSVFSSGKKLDPTKYHEFRVIERREVSDIPSC